MAFCLELVITAGELDRKKYSDEDSWRQEMGRERVGDRYEAKSLIESMQILYVVSKIPISIFLPKIQIMQCMMAVTPIF